tara:strand:+ start:2316 stop:3515 length:1200 start_codon:yes stop_codon:yes gene_type:complete
MYSIPESCPSWIKEKIHSKGGIISFYDYMDLALNDPVNGYYAKGTVSINKSGDFSTSPSISEEFCELFASQLEEWFIQLEDICKDDQSLSLIEFGSGEGHLILGIYLYLLKNNFNLVKKLKFYIIEINEGMINKQKKLFNEYQNFNVEWVTIDSLINREINGIVLAHEVLDSFPVERICLDKGKLRRQAVKCSSTDNSLCYVNIPLCSKVENQINRLNNFLTISIPPSEAEEGWTTELHIDNFNWFRKINKIMNIGMVIIVDYALDAINYYSPYRKDGTLLAYKNNAFTNSVLDYPGLMDLTSHLCLDTLLFDAMENDFILVDQTKQGQALLALGLAEELQSLRCQEEKGLNYLINKREILLRLVDPSFLGHFRWICFKKNQNELKKYNFNSKCFLEKI